MTTTTFGNWSFKFESTHMEVIKDTEQQKMLFLTKEYDDIHLIVEVVDGKLVFNPRWSVKITELNTQSYLIETNRFLPSVSEAIE